MSQGRGVVEGLTRFLALVVSGHICHGNDPILAWMASNAVTFGVGINRRLAKERSPEKIDGIAALVMGIEGAVVRRERTTQPEYQVIVVGGR